MIKTWIDAVGVTQYADEHSKAYRKRTERKTEDAAPNEVETSAAVEVAAPADSPAEPVRRPRSTGKTGEDSAG